MGRMRVLVSVVIVLCLGMQGSTFIWGTQVWPFMAYCMYAGSHDPPPQTMTRLLEAELADGSVVALTPERMGLSLFAWNAHYAVPAQHGESGAVARVAEHASRQLGQGVTAVRIVTREYTLRDGELIEEEKVQRRAVPASDTPGEGGGSVDAD